MRYPDANSSSSLGRCPPMPMHAPEPRASFPRSTASALASSPEPSAGWYWQTDSRLRITHLFGSALARSALGKRPWEVPGLDTSHPGWVLMFDAMLARRPFVNAAWLRRDAQGRLHSSLVSGEPVFGPKGRFLGYRGIGHMGPARASNAS